MLSSTLRRVGPTPGPEANKYTASNIRNPLLQRKLRPRWSFIRYILPSSVLGVAGIISYVIYIDQNKENTVCVDCVRQKQIMDEVYFSKKSPPSPCK